MAMVSLFILIIFCLCSEELIRLFTLKTEVVLIGGEYLLTDGLFWVLFGVMMMFTSYFRGVGYAFTTLIIYYVTFGKIPFILVFVRKVRNTRYMVGCSGRLVVGYCYICFLFQIFQNKNLQGIGFRVIYRAKPAFKPTKVLPVAVKIKLVSEDIYL